MTANELRALTEAYLGHYPAERESLQALLTQLDQPTVPTSRKTFPGHVTGSGIVLSPDKTKVLLIYHRVFNGWFQPGGHSEPSDPNPWTTARRETEEETAVQIQAQLPVYSGKPEIPLSINTHPVPDRPLKSEPAHSHHDFLYVFIAASEALQHQAAEVSDARWFALDAAETQNIRLALARMRQTGLIC